MLFKNIHCIGKNCILGQYYMIRKYVNLWTFLNPENLLAEKNQLFSCLGTNKMHNKKLLQTDKQRFNYRWCPPKLNLLLTLLSVVLAAGQILHLSPPPSVILPLHIFYSMLFQTFLSIVFPDALSSKCNMMTFVIDVKYLLHSAYLDKKIKYKQWHCI